MACRPSPNIRGGRPAPKKVEPVRRPGGPSKAAPSRQPDRGRPGAPGYGRDNRGRDNKDNKKKVGYGLSEVTLTPN